MLNPSAYFYLKTFIGASVVVLAFSQVACLFSAPPFKGDKSTHFDGMRFHNQVRSEPHFMGFWRWMFTREPKEWHEVKNNEHDKPKAQNTAGKINVTFINHATLLIQVDGINILTDPIWSERCSPVATFGPRRYRDPGVAFDDLPRIDVVLISHNHYDHLDLPTLWRLKEKFDPVIVSGLGNNLLLENNKIANAIELDWWQEFNFKGKTKITAVPAQHFSGRGLIDTNKTLWAGFVIESSSGPVYFAGDTGFGQHFEEIYQRFGAIKVALLPIGAFTPTWFMKPMHISPAEAVDAAEVLHAQNSIGIHFGTFRLADDGQDEPVKELANALLNKPNINFVTLDFGEGREF